MVVGLSFMLSPRYSGRDEQNLSQGSSSAVTKVEYFSASFVVELSLLSYMQHFVGHSVGAAGDCGLIRRKRSVRFRLLVWNEPTRLLKASLHRVDAWQGWRKQEVEFANTSQSESGEAEETVYQDLFCESL